MAWGMKWPKFTNKGYTTISSWKDIKDLTKKVEKALDKSPKEIMLKAPTSMRYFTKGSDGSYLTGDVHMIDTGLQQATDVQVASSAVAEVKYNPESNICSLRFVNGDKWYDYQMTPDEFEEFMAADSKGQYVNYVMKYENRID
jgi:hypothetical protein